MNDTDVSSYAPGQVVMVCLANALERPGARGKWRPAVLIRRDGGSWAVMGLTTSSRYRDGNPRTPIPNPAAVGLRGPGYIWGCRTARISVLDLGRQIGWVDLEFAEEVVSMAHLVGDDASALLAAAEVHHGSR
jgi:hypothetical protein